MAKNLGEFLHGQALKAGMNPEDENLKNFLLNGELIKIMVPEEIEKGIDNNLLSVKDAKNNHPDIKNYYQKQALDSIDNSITALLTELEIDEAVKNEVLSERSTYKRVPLLVNKIKELEEKKSATSGKGDKDGLQKQIDELHAQLRTEKEKAVNQQKQNESDLSKIKIKYKLDSLLGGYKTIHDKLDDTEVKNSILKVFIDKELQDNKAVFAFDEKDSFTLLKEDGTNYYGDNHQQVEPKGFIEQVLSRNKQLTVTDQQPSNGQGANNNGHVQPPGGSGNNSRNTTHIGLVQKAIQDLENSNAVTIMG